MSRRIITWLSVALLWLATSAQAVELVMIDARGCGYCEAWKREIGPAYPKSPEGKFAPLRIVDASRLRGSGLHLSRAVAFTPTFLLVDKNTELARIEGYPGDEFFWVVLDEMLSAHTSFGTQTVKK